MKGRLLGILVLIMPVIALVPVERRIHAERTRLKYGGARVSLAMRDRISQGMAIGLLAGFRGVVADFVWIQNQGFFERREWLRMFRNIELVTTLQPQSVSFWNSGQWHMAWNIGYAVSVDPANRTEAVGIKRSREWHERARTFIERGIENVPNRYDLYFTMAWLYDQKLIKDCGDDAACKQERQCKAAEYFEMAAQFPDAPPHIARQWARSVEKCGDVQRAYVIWKTLWSADRSKPHEMWNVIEREIKRLEDVLNIPDNQRVFPKP